jgi:hypothetical protein
LKERRKERGEEEEQERKTKVISFYVPFGILSAFF